MALKHSLCKCMHAFMLCCAVCVCTNIYFNASIPRSNLIFTSFLHIIFLLLFHLLHHSIRLLTHFFFIRIFLCVCLCMHAWVYMHLCTMRVQVQPEAKRSVITRHNTGIKKNKEKKKEVEKKKVSKKPKFITVITAEWLPC